MFNINNYIIIDAIVKSQKSDFHNQQIQQIDVVKTGQN